MKNYFESKETVLPFNNVLYVKLKGEYVVVYTIPGNGELWYTSDQYNNYIKWLDATSPEKYDITQAIPEERTKLIESVFGEPEPKQTLTAEQIGVIIRESLSDKYNDCLDCKFINKENCFSCEKNYEPTDEFVKRVNEVIK